MATLTVGTGQQFATIAAAVRATRDGDTVLVQAGTYTNDFFTVTNKITLQSVGGMAYLVATVQPPNGKGIIVADNDLTVDGFGFTGSAVSDGNGAGIRYDLGNLVVRNSVFWDNQNGILANAWSTGTIVIDNSEFSHNGAGDGYTHNLYVGEIASLTVTNSYFHDAVVGHEIKSRARSTTITGNRIQDNPLGSGSYSIDLPNGGVGVIENNVIEKGPGAENWITIHFGGEGTPYAGSKLSITNNTIINDHPKGYLVSNSAGASPVTLGGNRIWGYAADRVALGAVTQTGNTVLAARPTLDLTTRAPTVLPPPAVPLVTVVPENTRLEDWGPAGAVIRSGNILTVGAHGQFATLAAALTASRDGDTIKVAAGTYTNDFGTVRTKVVIEGVGGMARFVQSGVPDANNGILVVAADATLRNLEFTGAHNWNGREGGIEIRSGKVTIVNSWFHGNDIGILAGDNPDTSIVIVDSEIGPNGNPDRGTHNVTVGAIGSLVIRNSTIHGATTGHELSVRAYNALIEGNRIFDGAGVPASFSLNLGQGGNAIVRNNIFQKGPDATNGILVHVGGEGLAYSNSNVQITGNTFISDLRDNDHPYTFFIVGDDATGVHPATTASGNTFVGGVPGSQPLTRIANGGGNVTGAARTVDTSPTWSASRAPELFKPVQTGPNTLTLRLSEMRAEVDAQFTVTVDGVTVGGGLVTAERAAGASQEFKFSGWWGTGQHDVTVNAINVTYRSGPAAYVLYVDGVALDDTAIAPNKTILYWTPYWSTSIAGTTKLLDFDAGYYLNRYADVRAAGADPLQHYLSNGWREGRDPNAMFSTRYYLNQNPDVAASGVNPLLHFEQFGWAQGRDPSVNFSVSGYIAANPDVAAQNVDPLLHYTQIGRAEHRAAIPATPHATSSDPLVDSAWYYARHPDVAASGMDAAAHYHTAGWTQRYDPNAWFDVTWYRLNYTDVAAANVDPLLHYEQYGWREGRDPNAWFSTRNYQTAHPESANTNPLMSFLQGDEDGPKAALNPYSTPEAALFDAAYYTAMNPDVAANLFDPLAHFKVFGWLEGRNPSASFSTNNYLAAYSDVRAAHIDPLAHYADFGRAEGRMTFSV